MPDTLPLVKRDRHPDKTDEELEALYPDVAPGRRRGLFAKGNPGNPNAKGRPKKAKNLEVTRRERKKLNEIFEQILDETLVNELGLLDEDNGDPLGWDGVIRHIVHRALFAVDTRGKVGDFRYLKLLMQYGWGLPPREINMTHASLGDIIKMQAQQAAEASVTEIDALYEEVGE